ncbi:putative proteasome activator subunit [Phaeomoniella chlamydospora]|uniref:Putative proteasome activator subunit n=1 Tax=Phaeomoniella chlamydospora TaxID=158046 RepID=A0A0G2F3R3_PHACM|nr:putative proteasome activator subunit [Phaeomoniella chlamydospora]
MSNHTFVLSILKLLETNFSLPLGGTIDTMDSFRGRSDNNIIAALLNGGGSEASRATSPGGESPIDKDNSQNPDYKPFRSRPRTYPYFKHLPYDVEDEVTRQRQLEEIIKNLYIALEAGEFSPGAVHWTKELRSWITLKFDLPRGVRVKLAKLYYELSLAPGIDPNIAERFASVFMILTKRKHYLRPGKDLTLDWRPLYQEIKYYVLPAESGLIQTSTLKRNIKTLTKLCSFAQLYFDPQELPNMLEEFLPFFSTSFTEGAFVVVGLMNLMLPTQPGPADNPDLNPQTFLPTYFHLWSLINRSRTFDVNFLDYFSRLARDQVVAEHVPFSEYGLFTKDQANLIYTAILRLLEIPVGQATSAYIFYLTDFFVMRWNRERNGEMEVPKERRLNEAIKKRFVLCLRDVIFMGIYAKSGTAMSYSLSTLQGLAYLEPDLILPGALQRIYPSMQGLVEVHRTTSSLRSLQVLSRTMIRTKGYRCHITALLGLAIPGIDANDLEKSLITLSFIASVAYNIPFADLSQNRDDVHGNDVAMQWISGELERMEQEGAGVDLKYEELDDQEEELILRSSTAGFAEFLNSFLGRVFTLLENLPDAARLRSGSPEENIVNTLAAAFIPLLSSLSPELYDLALNKIVDFVSNHVIHQARDAMAFICNALCKVDPEKALDKLVPVLTRAIRTEIDENGAGSTRNAASDVLPRDRGLVWNVSMLSMCVVHVGKAVLKHRQELFDIAGYMQQKCKGMPTVHISNYIHHLLLNLTVTYTIDSSPFEDAVMANGPSVAHWGMHFKPVDIHPKWHVPIREELEFAVDLFKAQTTSALDSLKALITENSPIKRDGSGKDWSDEVSRNLVLLRLILSGVSVLFDAEGVSQGLETTNQAEHPVKGLLDETDTDAEGTDTEKDPSGGISDLDFQDELTPKPIFKIAAGPRLSPDDPLYIELHGLRQQTGWVLHDVHEFLCDKQEDDVSSFTPLYTAYRAWFVDVGIERSARVLDRVTKLLAADLTPYKVSGVRKDYPRPILVRRANLYHLQRLRQNAAPRPRSTLDEQLLFDLAESSVSLYTEIRRNAQSALESAFKVIIGSRMLVVPQLLSTFQKAVKESNFPRIKGSLYTLLFGTIARPLSYHWKYVPDVIRAFLEAINADKPSIQKLCNSAFYQILDYGRPTDRMAILNERIIQSIMPPDDVRSTIERKKKLVLKKRELTERKKAALAEEFIQLARRSHWKTATRAASIVMSCGLRFDHIASDNMIELIVTGTVDSHPGLRGMYSQTLVALFTMLDVRAVCNHDFANYIQSKQQYPARIQVEVNAEDPRWTEKFLTDFAQPEAEFYNDHDYPGWLVWGKTMPAYKSLERDIEYDEIEWVKRKNVGVLLTKDWFSTCFKYLKQEPRDAHADRFRMASVLMLHYTFELMIRDELTAATFDDIKSETLRVFEDGSDKHQHRATAEILGALISSVADTNVERRRMVWEFAFPIIRKVFSDLLTPENSGYWTSFLHMILQGRDPRRAWPLVDWLAGFRLDMSSNAAFKESSKIHLLHQVMLDSGWHFQLDRPITENFLAHIDHPYKGVREAMGSSLATIFRTRYHESFATVDSLIKTQKDSSSIGVQPYQPSEHFTNLINEVFQRIERWRQERPAGQQIPSSYTSGSKTVLLWLDSMLSSYECTTLLPFFPTVFTEAFLHMMDVKEDPELQSLAYHVFRHLPNIPQRSGEDGPLVNELIRIGRTSSSWHQRLRVMINMQIIFFRHLFLLSAENRKKLFDCVASMLEDSQHEVRAGASATLSGMIRCSPAELRNKTVQHFKIHFTQMLVKNPLPKKPRAQLLGGLGSARSTGTSTPTPEHQRLIITRHAAVLGLGALIQAFPYSSPPPSWMPDVLITLSSKAANDPGIVGSSVKSIISDFKKTRQDTWHIDMKAFEPEQLEDLSGVLWKSYFA